MMRGPVAWIVSSCLLLAGCTGPASWTPGPIVVQSPTVSASTASASASSSSTATASSTAVAPPVVPSTSGAINANKFPSAHFASPSGRIWCALYDDWALCHFPRGMTMTDVPPSDEICPGEELDVTGVSILKKADYFCSGGAEALPQTSGGYVGWWKGTGLPSVTYDGQKMAVLPYGKKLARKNYVCLSEKAGVTCANVTTKKGFRISLSGVIFIT